MNTISQQTAHMSFCELLGFFGSWAAVTFFLFGFVHHYKSDRALLIIGSSLLGLGFLVPMYLTVWLHDYLSCNQVVCEIGKIQATSLIGWFTISWAAIGANFLSSALSNKRGAP